MSNMPTVAHLTCVCFLVDHSQDMFIRCPGKEKLNLKGESADIEHVPHVYGQVSLTPGRSHQFLVWFHATHMQKLIIDALSFVILNLWRLSALQSVQQAVHFMIVTCPEPTPILPLLYAPIAEIPHHLKLTYILIHHPCGVRHTDTYAAWTKLWTT